MLYNQGSGLNQRRLNQINKQKFHKSRSLVINYIIFGNIYYDDIYRSMLTKINM